MASSTKIGMANMVAVSAGDIASVVLALTKENKIAGLLGPPGCGKTKGTESAARTRMKELGRTDFIENPTLQDWHDSAQPGSMKFCFMTVLLSQLEEIDMRGLPHVVEFNGERVTTYTPTELFPKEGFGWIFFDEMPNGKPSVQNASQQMLLNHAAGNYKISPNIKFVVAGNRPMDNCGTFNIPAALRDRIFWFEVIPLDKEGWLKLMSKIGSPIDIRLAGWLMSPIGEKYYNNFDPHADQYAYVTNRGLEMASDVIRGVSDHKLLRQLIGGKLGLDAGDDFVNFIELAETVDLNDILEHPEKIKRFADGDQGLLHSVCVALTIRACDAKQTDKVMQVMKALDRDEFGTLLIYGMIREIGKAKMVTQVRASNAGRELTMKYLDLMNME